MGTVSVMGGLIVYREFTDMILSQKIVFPIGVVITIGGVFYLVQQGQPEKCKVTKEDALMHESPSRNAKRSPNENEKDEEDIGGSRSVSDERSTVYFQDDAMDELDLNCKQHLFVDSNVVEDNKNIIGILQNLGDASIVTGSSLGKLLLDPQNIYRDIAFGQCIDEDQHFKGILSPTLMSEADEDLEDGSSEQLVSEHDRKQIDDESLSFLPEIEENMLFANETKKRKKKKRRRHSFHDTATDHHSDSVADERYNDRRRRRKRERKKNQKLRSRSHSPPLTADEMAPHEVVWEKFTSIFVSDKGNKADMKLSNYASLETPPDIVSKDNDDPEIQNEHDLA